MHVDNEEIKMILFKQICGRKKKELSFSLLWQKYGKIFLKFISQEISILFTLNELIALGTVTVTW